MESISPFWRNLICTEVILGSFYLHLGFFVARSFFRAHIRVFWIGSGFRISAYAAVGSNPVLQPDVIGHPEIFMCLGSEHFAWPCPLVDSGCDWVFCSVSMTTANSCISDQNQSTIGLGNFASNARPQESMYGWELTFQWFGGVLLAFGGGSGGILFFLSMCNCCRKGFCKSMQKCHPNSVLPKCHPKCF